MTFEDAIAYTKGGGTYTREECEALWKGLMAAPGGGFMLEIGCERGISSSIILQASKEREADAIFVDPFVNEGGVNAGKFLDHMRPLDIPFTLLMMRSDRAYKLLHTGLFDFIHIDGDHTKAGIEFDCKFLEMLAPRGVAAFHDYRYPDCPDIAPTVDKATAGWETIAIAGRCCVRRKP
jgi:predicted O-methyltransferase YrrM